MAATVYDFEGQTAGTAFTTTSSSPSVTAVTGTVTYSTDCVWNGSIGLKAVVGTANTPSYITIPLTAATQQSLGVGFLLPSLPSATLDLMQILVTASIGAKLQLTTAGQLQLVDNAGVTVGIFPGFTWAASTKYYVTVRLTSNATGAGTDTIAIYDSNGKFLSQSQTTTGSFGSSVSLNNIKVGVVDSLQASGFEVAFDYVQTESATFTEHPAPVTAPTQPVTNYPILQGIVDAGWTTGTTNVAQLPSQCVSGDWMLMAVELGLGGTVTTPTGWTLLLAATAMGSRTAALYGKISAGETSVSVVHTSGNGRVGILFGSSSGPVSAWQIGTSELRSATGTTFNNVMPAITTAASNELAIGVSFEATSATETAVSSISGPLSTVAFMQQFTGSLIETMWFGQLLQTAPGTVAAQTVVYPNTQASNGLGIMIGVSEPATQTGSSALSGSGSLSATATPAPVGAAALAGSGTVTALGSGSSGSTGAATLAGGGTVTAAASNETMNGTAALAGSGTVTTSGTPKLVGAATLSGSGTVTAVSGTPVSNFMAALNAGGMVANVAHFGFDTDVPPGLVQAAYDQAADWASGPNLALEVDVWPSSDSPSTWVVSHDQTTDIFNSTVTITSTPWASMSGFVTLTGSHPIMELIGFLNRYAVGNRVIFIDNKGNLQYSALLAILDLYGGPDRFILKNYCTGTGWIDAGKAHNAAYKGWGYYYDADVNSGNMATQSHWDILGMDVVGTSTSADWVILRSYNKPILAHIVQTQSQKTTASGFSANGLMASSKEVVPQTPEGTNLTGSGTVTTTTTPKPVGAASLAGSGTLSATATPKPVGAAALAGSGTVTTSAAPHPVGAATLAGSGTITTSAAATGSGSATLAGSGTATAGGTPNVTGAAALAGSGTVTTSATPKVIGAATLAGSGTLTAAGSGSGSGSGSTSIGGSGTVTTGGTPRIVGAAALAGSGAVSTSFTPHPVGAATLAGSGTVSTSFIATPVGAASLAGSGTVTTTFTPNVVGAATLTGSGTVTTASSGSQHLSGTAALTGLGVLSAAAIAHVVGGATLTGSGTATATGSTGILASYWNGTTEVPGVFFYWDGTTERVIVSAEVV